MDNLKADAAACGKVLTEFSAWLDSRAEGLTCGEVCMHGTVTPGQSVSGVANKGQNR